MIPTELPVFSFVYFYSTLIWGLCEILWIQNARMDTKNKNLRDAIKMFFIAFRKIGRHVPPLNGKLGVAMWLALANKISVKVICIISGGSFKSQNMIQHILFYCLGNLGVFIKIDDSMTLAPLLVTCWSVIEI